MKRFSLILTIALMSISLSVMAQDSAQVMYIPGMPVPQTTSASTGSSDQAAAAVDSSSSQSSNKIAGVTKAGEMNVNAPANSPQPQDQTATGKADYKGVTPPTRMVPENAATFQHTQANQMSWIGFMPEGNQHRIFLQTSQPTAYEQIATSADKIELLLLGTSLAVTNNQRELDMTYFKTPFKSAKASPAGKDVRVVIQLKEAVPYEIKSHDNLLEVFVKPANQ